eukprot:scaffold233_cov174-Ochromonas_danica.AAC.19
MMSKKKQFIFKLIYKVDEDSEFIRDELNHLESSKVEGSVPNSGAVGLGGINGEGTSKSVGFSSSPSTPIAPSLSTTAKKSVKKISSSNHTGTKVAAVAVGGVIVGALTAGIGLLAGMMVVGAGAAATGGAVAMSALSDGKERHVLLATDTQEDAEAWVKAIDQAIQDLAGNVTGLPILPISSSRRRPGGPILTLHPDVRIDDVEEWLTNTKWKIFDIFEGLRLLQPDYTYSENNRLEEPMLPCLRANVAINASALDVFSLISNFTNVSSTLKAGLVESIRMVAHIDNYTDVLHVKLRSIFLAPTWTAPRDFVVLRYWRDHEGSYIICLDSTTHEDCPLVEGYVRGELHASYIITPPKNKMSTGYHKNDEEDEEANESMLTLIAQMDPKGWIWRAFNYKEQFLREFMLQVLDIRDVLEGERFVQYHFDPIPAPKMDVLAANASAKAESQVEGSIATIPPPNISHSMWAESDASTFKVRGPTYNIDKVKVTSAPAMFKLLAADLYEVPESTKNIAAHPRNRVHLALQRGDPTWVFVVNILIPGSPFLLFVAYFKGDKAAIEADTPFGRLARPFFYGNDDEERNNRFKLIPRILDGNLMIKMAVKDTPTLIGNKIKNHYFKGENYFELDIDVSSSSVARNITGLAMGYSKNIVVDLGFCLQGNEEDELPEVLMGGCTCIHVDASTAKKL